MLSSSSSPDIEERDSPDMDEDSDKKVDNAEEAVEKVLICVMYLQFRVCHSRYFLKSLVPIGFYRASPTWE